jgi:hypothetical protein
MAASHRSLLAIVVCIALPGLALADPPIAVRHLPHLRYTDPIIAAAVTRGGDSPAFVALRASIERSDVIVVIERAACSGRGTGTTQFLTEAGGYRYVRVTLRVRAAGDPETALLAHELQHVAELVTASAVRDEAGYLSLYRRIGSPGCGAPTWCFDTAAARDMGMTVLRELRGMPGPSRGPRRAETW